MVEGALADRSERFKCHSAACVDRSRQRKVWVNASTVVQQLDAELADWTGILQWTRRYTFADVQYHTYRDLSRDPLCEVKRIFSFLGVRRFLVASNETTLKMGAPTPRLDIDNADEVAAALRGTRWEGEVDRKFA